MQTILSSSYNSGIYFLTGFVQRRVPIAISSRKLRHKRAPAMQKPIESEPKNLNALNDPAYAEIGEPNVPAHGEPGKGLKDVVLLKNAMVRAARPQNIPEYFIQQRSNLLKLKDSNRHVSRALEKLLDRRRAENDLHAAYVRLPVGWRSKTESKKGITAAPKYTAIETLAYLQHLAIPSFHVHHQIFSEVRRLHSWFQPTSVLDFGSGPGSGIVAAKAVWPTLNIAEAVDLSASMRDACRQVIDQAGFTQKGWSSSLTQLSEQFSRQKLTFDLVNAGYVLGELPTDASRMAAVSLLWSLVHPNGMLTFVERGSAYGSFTVRSARKQLAEDADTCASGLRAHVLGPCPHSKACPLSKEGNVDSCTFTLNIPQMAREGQAGPRTEGFSYVVLHRPSGPQDKNTPDSLEQGDLPSDSEYARIIRAPLKRKGHIVLDLCLPEGLSCRKVVTKARLKHITGGYHAARKSTLGGLWKFKDI